MKTLGGKVFTSEPFHYLSASRSTEQEYEHTKTLLRAYFNERVQGAGRRECGQLRRCWWFSSVVQRDHRKRWKHEGAHLESSPRERANQRPPTFASFTLFSLFSYFASSLAAARPFRLLHRQVILASSLKPVTRDLLPLLFRLDLRSPRAPRVPCFFFSSFSLLPFFFFFVFSVGRSKHEPIFSDT